jgi:hypothetical protein
VCRGAAGGVQANHGIQDALNILFYYTKVSAGGVGERYLHSPSPLALLSDPAYTSVNCWPDLARHHRWPAASGRIHS